MREAGRRGEETGRSRCGRVRFVAGRPPTGRGRGFLDAGETAWPSPPTATADVPPRLRSRSSSGQQMQVGVLREELVPQPCGEALGSQPAQILVEVAKLRRKH